MMISIHLSIYPSIHLSIHPSIHPSIHLSTVHFPHIDVDLNIPALLEGFWGSKRWMAAENGKLGGRATSAAKSEAAR